METGSVESQVSSAVPQSSGALMHNKNPGSLVFLDRTQGIFSLLLFH